MELIYPSYYDDFKCIAGACPDSCCHEWEVEVDETSADRYRGMTDALGDDLRRYLYDEDGGTYMRNQDNRCPMWRSDGLCRIQAELGHEALCQVCQQFPRLRHDYGDFLEMGLEMSCPEAARLILSTPDYGMCLRTIPGGEEPEYDALDMEILRTTRDEAVDILLNRDLSVGQALAALLFYGYRAQQMLDDGEISEFSEEQALADAWQWAKPGDMVELVSFYGELEILTDRWREKLAGDICIRSWCEADRAFARYLVERYWLQAISDLDLLSRVKFVVVSCLLVRALPGEVEQVAQLYSKEIENDIQNVESILDGTYTERAMTDENLLGLLLQ